MDDEPLKQRRKSLEEELETIRQHNRKYLAKRVHSLFTRREHRAFERLAAEVMSELAKVLRKINTWAVLISGRAGNLRRQEESRV